MLRTVLMAALISIGPAQAAGEDVVEGPARVLDGGTLRIDDKTLRLHGIIAPSARQKCRRGHLPWLCGAAARSHLVSLTEGGTVRCHIVKLPAARCYVGDTDLARDMVRNGWAVPDAEGRGYREDEETARADRLGMWEVVE